MTKSKISILSSSTCCLDVKPDEVKPDKVSKAGGDDDMTSHYPYDTLSTRSSNNTNAYDTLYPGTSVPGNSYNKLLSTLPDCSSAIALSNESKRGIDFVKAEREEQPKDIAENDRREDSLTDSSTSRSSFREELLYHFERRLSDLGPRSKYPCLQKLERSVTSGAYDTCEKLTKDSGGEKRAERSRENLAAKRRIARGGGRKWKRCGGYFNANDFVKGALSGQGRDGEGQERDDKITILPSVQPSHPTNMESTNCQKNCYDTLAKHH